MKHAGVLIPDLAVHKSVYLGKGFFIFTSQLYIICNINCIELHLPLINLLAIVNILICVETKSVLHVLQNWDWKMRKDMYRYRER